MKHGFLACFPIDLVLFLQVGFSSFLVYISSDPMKVHESSSVVFSAKKCDHSTHYSLASWEGGTTIMKHVICLYSLYGVNIGQNVSSGQVLVKCQCVNSTWKRRDSRLLMSSDPFNWSFFTFPFAENSWKHLGWGVITSMFNISCIWRKNRSRISSRNSLTH